MRKKLVKLLFHMLCAAAIVAGLCAAATALQVDGLTLRSRDTAAGCVSVGGHL